MLPSVPGTEAAEDAVADAAIPQTAAIDRSEARLDVTYDGEPQFETVEGTQMAYAVNASTAILRINGLYYACDQAVWFVSSSPTGPWAVSDSVPEAVQTIPPSSPVYNVKYVVVYQTTPDVVYVGYTPGYLGTYPYYGTAVYGTGWRYRPYVGHTYYFARPWTWGLGPHYHPWYGWSFGAGYNRGFLVIGVAWGGGYRARHGPGPRSARRAIAPVPRPTFTRGPSVGPWSSPGRRQGCRLARQPRPGHRPGIRARPRSGRTTCS